MTQWEVRHGDSRELIKALPDNSVDSVVVDPPYEYAFMNAKWDGTGIAFDLDLWREVLRVIKPGGHMVVFGADRTVHRVMCAIEDAGFELRCSGCWVSAQSFPKSLNASKAIDAALGADREVVGHDASRVRPNRLYEGGAIGNIGGTGKVSDRTDNGATITAPATPEAARWEGWGTALKTMEPWVLARKPPEGTIAGNLLKWGVGALNIDGCRLPGQPRATGLRNAPQSVPFANVYGTNNDPLQGLRYDADLPDGRWPSALICTDLDIEGPAQGIVVLDDVEGELDGVLGPQTKFFRIAEHTVAAIPDELLGAVLPTLVLCPKAGVGERELGCDALPERWVDPSRLDEAAGRNNPRAGAGRKAKRRNVHPSVKPISVMRHLVRLVTPPGGLVLDHFCGSGSTGIASVWEGARFLGFELNDTDEHPYVRTARARIGRAAVMQVPALTARVAKPVANDAKQTGFTF